MGIVANTILLRISLPPSSYFSTKNVNRALRKLEGLFALQLKICVVLSWFMFLNESSNDFFNLRKYYRMLQLPFLTIKYFFNFEFGPYCCQGHVSQEQGGLLFK